MNYKDKIKVDDIVFLKPGTNVSRYNKGIRQGKITKIGRKYFHVSLLDDNDEPMKYYTYRFNIEDLRQVTEYTADYYLYLNEEDLINEKTRNECIKYIRDIFSMWNCETSKLSTETLVKIKNMIEND